MEPDPPTGTEPLRPEEERAGLSFDAVSLRLETHSTVYDSSEDGQEHPPRTSITGQVRLVHGDRIGIGDDFGHGALDQECRLTIEPRSLTSTVTQWDVTFARVSHTWSLIIRCSDELFEAISDSIQSRRLEHLSISTQLHGGLRYIGQPPSDASFKPADYYVLSHSPRTVRSDPLVEEADPLRGWAAEFYLAERMLECELAPKPTTDDWDDEANRPSDEWYEHMRLYREERNSTPPMRVETDRIEELIDAAVNRLALALLVVAAFFFGALLVLLPL